MFALSVVVNQRNYGGDVWMYVSLQTEAKLEGGKSNEDDPSGAAEQRKRKREKREKDRKKKIKADESGRWRIALVIDVLQTFFN